jgi:hypothetical protein
VIKCRAKAASQYPPSIHTRELRVDGPHAQSVVAFGEHATKDEGQQAMVIRPLWLAEGQKL